MTEKVSTPCTRRMFLLGTATTFAGALLAACGSKSANVSVDDVPVGSAVIVDGFIIAQPQKGQYVAYSAVCPHQHNMISKVEGDRVKCTKHGSEFSIVDGSVLNSPARDPLTPAQVAQEGDSLTATP
ncbi:Rieske (2Fe-2S) protein [Corynebacterium glucuronolyticum]|uniref:Rieske (2Fe-2S) protein n=1 Tax=Corynebacterium glucuronolyticum TaxID=39791 RepID=A0A7T4JVG1_9CORY|nr:Rieske (2Fe-2S) protein [Corynebacterium glucuronolyticum]QQB46878.1 Rieske (2Fe-2S) protein [Corynebacterium glucuronolyticum]WKD64847.1 3-phenylpropionate dioxygenase ferredoxin subunit [Corynebacterium glucuronolyticum DSM 44120]SMB87075.1 Ferredoxin subunit of nitrite reductase or a ring-hydroxylating dioxygenase [Corynebacterium glucuronolyticum]